MSKEQRMLRVPLPQAPLPSYSDYGHGGGQASKLSAGRMILSYLSRLFSKGINIMPPSCCAAEDVQEVFGSRQSFTFETALEQSAEVVAGALADLQRANQNSKIVLLDEQVQVREETGWWASCNNLKLHTQCVYLLRCCPMSVPSQLHSQYVTCRSAR